MNRPVLRYYGGKWKLAPWIISHFPEHRVYTDVFGGAASVLLRKERSYAEVYNDLDGEIVNVFKILRDPASAKYLRNLLELTPFSREEFELSYETTDDACEMARRTIVRSYMGFGSAATCILHLTGFRSNCQRSGTTPAHDWVNYVDLIESFTDRLRGVVIESLDAVRVLQAHDSKETLHYVDPPYVHSTRTFKRSRGKQVYRHELTDTQHEELAAVLLDLDAQMQQVMKMESIS